MAANPTISISAHSRVVTEAANYAAAGVHRDQKLYDFSIGRTVITERLVQRGNQVQLKLKKLFDISAQTKECAVSAVIDYWTGRHQLPVPYGGIMACVIDDQYEWHQFPICLTPLLDKTSKNAEFTFTLLAEAVGPEFEKFTDPFFVTSDNEAKMVAAFDSLGK